MDIKEEKLFKIYISKSERYEKLIFLKKMDNFYNLAYAGEDKFIKGELEKIINKTSIKRGKFYLVLDSEIIINSKLLYSKTFLDLWSNLRYISYLEMPIELEIKKKDIKNIKDNFLDAILYIGDGNIRKDTLEIAYTLYKENKKKGFAYYLKIANNLI
jgi:hypothetical protein